jgi:hypothetical protein
VSSGANLLALPIDRQLLQAAESTSGTNQVTERMLYASTSRPGIMLLRSIVLASSG